MKLGTLIWYERSLRRGDYCSHVVSYLVNLIADKRSEKP